MTRASSNNSSVDLPAGRTPFPGRPILLVDDEPTVLQGLELTLKAAGITNVRRCNDAAEVVGLLAAEEHELLCLDLLMPRRSGREILVDVHRDHPELPVIVVTAVEELDTAVECMRAGASDYVVKPVQPERLVRSVRQALELRGLRRENERLRDALFTDALRRPEAFEALVTRSPRMRAVFHYIEAIAAGSSPVLITGETGTGKELVAGAVHAASGRKGPLVAVNLAGLDEQQFGDTLFGHVKGAFPGADAPRGGLIEQARGGTLFLDEVGDLAESSQIKLLRLLDQGQFFPLGADVARPSDVRVLCATHQEPSELLAAGTLRRDLYYRLRTHWVHLPPLRERSEDVDALLDHFLAEAARELGKRVPTYHPALLDLLRAYHYPGNVRELRAMAFDAVAGHKGRMLSSSSFRAHMGLADAPDAPPTEGEDASGWIRGLDKLPTLQEAKEALVTEALRRTENNQRAAAALLGISHQALGKRLRRAATRDD